MKRRRWVSRAFGLALCVIVVAGKHHGDIALGALIGYALLVVQTIAENAVDRRKP
jgi:hypothetical protein